MSEQLATNTTPITTLLEQAKTFDEKGSHALAGTALIKAQSTMSRMAATANETGEGQDVLGAMQQEFSRTIGGVSDDTRTAYGEEFSKAASSVAVGR